ncbi:hypothetical protein DSAG12_01580 [Promethearchaeum syntrophicum]|uniref:Phosphotyrosine protein phosphatase I domain-containing protein n=1 Tax=Promethearchaeum syntrophicum TaxID=2594042 RepID=A0A5B9D9I7_9ARCH|nr:hypothetical protein [Candidatus Prometheoarchaeum syntrophicum]QEE15753.1 tyrosine phosphatase [Candidatus Prometheoarchaeum syntrophicum]
MKKTKITILCVGNICRSPVGEYLLREYAKERGFSQSIIIDSAGLHGGFLELAKDSRDYLKEKGIDPSDFKSKGISRKYLDQFDNIWVMANWHKKFIIDHYYAELPRKERRKIKSKMKTLVEVSGEGSGDVTDPYGLPSNEYLQILKQIDRLSKKIIDQLKF